MSPLLAVTYSNKKEIKHYNYKEQTSGIKIK